MATSLSLFVVSYLCRLLAVSFPRCIVSSWCRCQTATTTAELERGEYVRFAVFCAVLSATLVSLANGASAQTSTTQLQGEWTFDRDTGESLTCHMMFVGDDKSGLDFSDSLPEEGAAWQYPGKWKLVSEEEDDEMRARVTIKVEWDHQPGMEHHVVITFLEKDRIEMAFNDEPLRIYKRVR